jgi:hypothetical protein
MRFLRRRSSPVLVVLLAFAMQATLILAQTHTHSHTYSAAGARAWAQGVVSLACRAITAQCSSPTVPHDHGGDSCPMCCQLAAAGTAVLPALPFVSLAAPPLEVLRPLRVAPLLAETATVHFQARAPPLA